MRTKTINAVLTKKFKDFCESIEDEKVRKLVENNTIITGGAITSMYLGETIHDFDLYFRTGECAYAVAKYYTQDTPEARVLGLEMSEVQPEDTPHLKAKHAAMDRVTIFIRSKGTVGTPEKEEDDFTMDGDFEPEVAPDETEPKYKLVFLSSNAITLSNKIQLIVRFFGEPEDIHKNYDFEHCKNYWTSWEKKVVTNTRSLECLLAKELFYTGSKYPICSIFRTRKFIERGWRINAGQYLKMAMQVQQLDLTDINVLEDQLIGVDTSFFCIIISKLREEGKETVEIGYLEEIINKVF